MNPKAAALHTVVVVSGGDPPDPRSARLVPADAPVLVADSGGDHALALGLSVDHIVGDFDSVSASTLAAIEASGGLLDRHPVAKDHTDLELALRLARSLDPDHIMVIGGHGGRADHLMAGTLLLAAPWLDPATVSAWHGDTLVSVAKARRLVEIRGKVGSIVSLIPLSADRPAGPVRTFGLAFPLHGESLDFGTTRGVSNVLTKEVGSVHTDHGALVVIQPGALSHHLTLTADEGAGE